VNDIEYTDYLDDYQIEPDNYEAIKVKAGPIVFFFILGLVFSSLSGVRDTSGPIFLVARWTLAGLLIVSVIMPMRMGLPLFFLLILSGADLTQGASEKEAFGMYNIASVWRLYLGPVRPSWIMFAYVLIQLVKMMTPALDRRVKKVAIWFCTVPVITGFIYDGYFTPVRSIWVAADVRFGLMLIMCIVLFHTFLRIHPQSLGTMLAAFIGALIGRHLCDLVYWFAGLGPTLGGVSRASVDSAKSAAVFLLLFSIFLIIKKKKILTGSAIGLLSLILIVVYSTRMIWLTAAVCCMILLYLYGAKRSILIAPLLVILLFGTVKIIRSYRAKSLEVATGRTSGVAAKDSGNFLERLDPLRYTEILNSVDANLRRGAILFGSGYGSYYGEGVRKFPRRLIDAFGEYLCFSGVIQTWYYRLDYYYRPLAKSGLELL
jgi:hypothetical protein